MFILIKIMKALGGLLPLLGALQLMKFTLNEQLAAHGLHIPVWVTEVTIVVFTLVFLMALTTLFMGRSRLAPAGSPVSTPVCRSPRRAATAPESGNQTRYRQRLNALSNYL
jgi:hypothetical protein